MLSITQCLRCALTAAFLLSPGASWGQRVDPQLPLDKATASWTENAGGARPIISADAPPAGADAAWWNAVTKDLARPENSSSPGSSPVWTAEGDLATAMFGVSVTTAGDVNGDGYSDVIVGAWVYDNGQTNEGRAFVYHGSPNGPSLTPNWIAEGESAEVYFGYSVATAGDVNGDGFDDIIVGAYRYDNVQSDEGRAFVYHGSASGLSPAPNWTAESDQAFADFGTEVATAGDVNGDGFDDVIVGCPFFDNGQNNEGRAFVYHGSASGLSPSPNWSGEGNSIGAQFGNSVATAGDVNGDGFADVIVGSWVYSNGQSNEGRALAYHGSASGLSATPNWSAEGNLSNAFFGSIVAGAGDVNGDGFADVIVGSPGYTNGQSSEGRAFVYRGSATGLIGTPAWTAEPNQEGTSYGQSVATAGDVNGDGFADVIVGAPNWTNGQFTEGRADVYQGSAAGLPSTPSWTTESNQANGGFGNSTGTAGDVNGDGYSDVIVGAWTYDNGQPDEGAAFVYLGVSPGLGTTPAWTGGADQGSVQNTRWIASAGDVNGDGYADAIVGGHVYSNGQLSEGRAMVYHGSAAGLATSPAWTAEGDQINAFFGWSVATAGDVNGDGYSDVIVGAFGYGNEEFGFGEGRAFVYHGSASGLAISPSWTADGNQFGEAFGFSVATAGDVNGDGYGDVIVGAVNPNNDWNNDGIVFVYHGSAAGLAATPAWTVAGDQDNAQFGFVVATAGDVHRRGFSDVIIGAPLYDSGSLQDAGRAFVYRGSATGLGTNPLLIGGAGAGDQFGYSVGTAGDVNGDGCSDVIVGAPEFSGGEMREGRAYVFYGSTNGFLTTFWIVDGNQDNAELGSAVSTAGDVNGDGYSDVVVGAWLYSGIQSFGGRVSVYHGSEDGVADIASWVVDSPILNQLGVAVATAGDVNGDGYSDVLAGAHSGGAYAYLGNGGDGLDHILEQERTDGSANISPLGMSDSPSAFRLTALGRSPAGRSRVRLEYEVKTLGAPFDGSGTITSGLVDTGAPVVGIGSAMPFSELATGLSDEATYRWRVRFHSDSPFFPRSRWLSLSANGSGETDVRTPSSSTSVSAAPSTTSVAILQSGVPNPFTSATQLEYTLPDGGLTRLAVFDVSGRKVAVLANETQIAGRHVVAWDGRDEDRRRLPAGVYFARLEFNGRVEGTKLILAH